MKILCKILGGSRAYELHTSTSDVDHRGVFLNTDLSKIIGLQRFDHYITQQEDDIALYELRHFFSLLRQSNSQLLEILYSNRFLEINDEFYDLVIKNREKLVDTKKLYKTLKGYINGERRRANGNLPGKIGHKRNLQIKRFNYSPNNFVQLFRLIAVGKCFFQNQHYPVNIKEYDLELWKQLYEIKTKPESFKREDLDDLSWHKERELDQVFDSRDKTKDLTFNEDYANLLLLKFYYPILHEKWNLRQKS